MFRKNRRDIDQEEKQTVNIIGRNRQKEVERDRVKDRKTDQIDRKRKKDRQKERGRSER